MDITDNQTHERTKEYLHHFRLQRSERMVAIREINVPVQCTTDIRDEFFEGQNRQRIVIYLPSSGCEWSFNHGGCNMCGHYLNQGGTPIKPELIINAFRAQVEQIEWNQYPIVNIYNNGSF